MKSKNIAARHGNSPTAKVTPATPAAKAAAPARQNGAGEGRGNGNARGNGNGRGKEHKQHRESQREAHRETLTEQPSIERLLGAPSGGSREQRGLQKAELL